LTQLLDLGHVPYVLAEQLLHAQAPPSAAESDVPLDKGLGISAVGPQGREVVLGDGPWAPDDAIRIGQVLPNRLGHREGVHAVQEIPPHQAVSTPTVHVHTGAARDQDADLSGIGVEESFEELLPLVELVQLIEEDRRCRGPEPLEPQPLGHSRRPSQDQCAVVPIVPVEVDIGQQTTGRGLSCLFTFLLHFPPSCQSTVSPPHPPGGDSTLE